ncbi:sodium-coupled transporter [Haloferax mediterranei ATCC 33500]|uniref:Potassium transporter TrkA n=1 Tax=Haloferax mediterranei (strain ATCC 33500 / DSM 1411 / JCM 8866 / NBRC 14739 / NCIMB 2177 / R-4) TaxID=523841 RepID=I3R199_HALMT|nr:SLC13 family permease [Haloferax mediterranei]AFK18009.1 sodium/sulfate symporter family transporter [Haloferax mediterranei ATCC 33500]AHZ22575.1 potassium transporter TrkA [Haloferax mediterranei ATCC 33500]EMA02715.1 sodium/sulfate symporter family transporter [Haloferax mediterranei ATCC 33500]MDX5988101.1 SLC13 family permease [Haloferax mediterranei ATCC 33500]QCQ74552.1 sodium-coupled transporter [Haloferax mediterranei ATCC 33500]
MVAITPGILVVFAVILVALVFFATEPVPVDVTAIGVMVTLMVIQPVSEALVSVGLLGAPITLFESYPGDALSGFANTATLTVLAMFILSEGIQRTGLVQMLGAKISSFTGDSEFRQLGATVGVVGPISGFINNTAAVAILLPMVTDLAERGKTSPSKLLLPLSYASMFGGMLTLIGTSTNILASDVYSRITGEAPISMFEFTALGAVVMAVGMVYLLTVGRRLTPARIEPRGDLTEEFEMAEYLTEVAVREDSPLVGQQVQQVLVDTEFDVDLLQLIRGDSVFLEPLGPKEIRPGDVFTLRTDRNTLVELLDMEGLDLVPDTITEDELELADEGQNLVEVVIAPGSSLVGESLATTSFRQRYDATVLALRRGGELIRRRMDNLPLRVGDTLLVQATVDSIERLDNNRNFIVAQEIERHDYRESKIPVAVGIVAGVVALAAIDFLPIVVSALLGALVMVATGCLRPTELYDAVQWDVIFLLAGVIPLGIAMENSGAAELLAEMVVMSGEFLPLLAVLGVFYFVTALLTNIISNNASVVLMIPVAIEAATTLGARPFSFVLAVMFAASTAFMTPVGYQTNLFVYGPGGYKFSDYIRVGGPLQLVLGVVTTIGVAYFFPLT